MTPRAIVCVCTYERPGSLARLLASLERLRAPGLEDARLRVHVVDNAPSRSAEPVVAAHAAASRFATTYAAEPRKGLSHARNAALEAALASGAEVTLFIDDDEAATPGWLAAHLDVLDRTGAQASFGPVRPVFLDPPPAWALGGFFAVEDPPGAVEAREGRTCNAAIRSAAIAHAGLRFDVAFNDIGGEDTDFFRRGQALGWRLAVAADALAYEVATPEKVRLAWLARRWFRTGGVEARLARRPFRSPLGRATNAARGLARIGAGGALAAAAALAGGWRDPSRTVARLYTVCRGGGLVANALGFDYREYEKPRALEGGG